MDTPTIIRIVAGLLFMAMLVVLVIFMYSLSRALGKCAPSSRTMQPGMVWLWFVPFVNLVWPFLVVSALSKSLGNEFRARGIVQEPEPAKGLGIALAATGACIAVPILNILAIPVHFVLIVLYWVKIAEYSRLLDEPSGANVLPSVI